MVERKPRTRLAPSPTGNLHLGHARTYLAAWLAARRRAGTVVMRIEDLDQPRVRTGAAETIYDDLRWLGIDWDEGPDVGGPFAPYVQSERLAHYETALTQLRRDGWVYPCTCSRREIREIAAAPHGEDGPIYPGTCREGPSHPGRAGSLRFRFEEPSPGFVDRIHGPIEAGRVRGDFVLQRSDGVVAYQLACVVDDIAMQVSEVVRGDDLIPSTPRQIALYRALRCEVPEFAHVPLVLGGDGERLAKRHGAVAVADYRNAGIPAERVVGWLAHSLGIAGSDWQGRPTELLAHFDESKIPRSAVAMQSPPSL